ncbi:MAG: aminomethyl-transferring glycine dehydrogenase subunit GcvPA, partial [SAR202 cluster bacterium]|nr:aminomethyl-transferring glycine dehydrogenase subunit GcvPA [SAR202 cluster bacterium]
DRQAMLAAIGVEAVEELFADIPPEARNPVLRLPPPLPELELRRELEKLASEDCLGELTFLGGGRYQHFVPAVVRNMVSRGEFATAYTPYQPEISQGTLQAIFEFQSLTCQLMGMEVANAGMYDGASALAEACLMACRVTGRRQVLALDTVSRRALEVARTYTQALQIRIDTVPAFPRQVDADVAALVVQHPNCYGYLEAVEDAAAAAHAGEALLITSVDPISLGMLRPPGELGADLAVADGQSLGNPVAFGGPSVGLFASRQRFVRQLPGRLVGQTVDLDGRTGYVLTLQTREQHIRREHATSNICTNDSLVAVAATIYLAALGKGGLRQVAELCYHKAHYAAQKIAALPGYRLPMAGTFFKEFVVSCPRPPQEINARLLERGIVGGLDISDAVPNGMLLCVTELHRREDIDVLVAGLAAIP